MVKKYFLESEYPEQDRKTALFHVIPAPLEASVSYGGGTSMGPEAILDSSNQLEIWDGFSAPGNEGIYTYSPVESDGSTESFLDSLENRISSVLSDEKIPVILGGEHTIAVASFRAMRKLGIDAGIIQFDAHSDLRDIYEDNRLSHACVMKRAYDLGFSIFQAGTRSLSPEEVMLRQKSSRIHYTDAYEAVMNNIIEINLPADFPDNVYITFDVDGLDPSVIPATGTPEPGGLSWYQALSMVESLASVKRIIGFDVNELAPEYIMKNGSKLSLSRVSEFTAARLAYNIMGIIQRSRRQS